MLIPILDFENKLQVNDLIRFDASKSIAVKGTVNPINSVKIKAGESSSEIEVHDADNRKWFLDYIFTGYEFDVDNTNNEVVFTLNGVKYTGLVVSGSYSLNDLLLALKNAMEAVAPSITVTTSVDNKNRITITTSSPVELLPSYSTKDLLQHLGFYKKGINTGAPIEYCLKKITLTVASISENKTLVSFLKLYTVEGDALFSNDSDLVVKEHDIMKWVSKGRSSHLSTHRNAQAEIVDWLDRKGYRDINGDKLTKFSFVDNSDVRTWSTYLTLKLFFMGNNNQNDDIFKEKAKYYDGLCIEARNRAVLSLDIDGDGEPEKNQGPDISSGRLFFR